MSLFVLMTNLRQDTLAKTNLAFHSASHWKAGAEPYALAVGDFDGDGHIDLAVVNWGDPSMGTILFGNGNGAFRAGGDFHSGRLPIAIASGDFKGDGKLDLVTANLVDSIIPGNRRFRWRLTAWPSPTSRMIVSRT
ncbi:MAG: VCBS repeat-containing protein [Verrucomicrobiota bacterium]